MPPELCASSSFACFCSLHVLALRGAISRRFRRFFSTGLPETPQHIVNFIPDNSAEILLRRDTQQGKRILARIVIFQSLF
jgi:hypothetical protein